MPTGSQVGHVLLNNFTWAQSCPNYSKFIDPIISIAKSSFIFPYKHAPKFILKNKNPLINIWMYTLIDIFFCQCANTNGHKHKEKTWFCLAWEIFSNSGYNCREFWTLPISQFASQDF